MIIKSLPRDPSQNHIQVLYQENQLTLTQRPRYYMKEFSHFAGSSLESGHGSSNMLAKQHLYPWNFDDTHNQFEEETHNSSDCETLHKHHDSHSMGWGDAHMVDQSSMLNMDFDTDAINAHHLQPSEYTPQSARWANDGFLCTFNDSWSVEEPSITLKLPSQPPVSQHSSAPAHTPSHHYGPFLGRFSTSEDAKVYRRNRMRFDRMPWRDPTSDPTIAETESHRDFHVERIYNAMICGDFARDNANSTALKRWVYGAHYESGLVEAYAHKVFDCLLEQVKKGFRGWHQNDYVNDERKGEDDDKDVDCAGRLGK